MIYLIVEIVEYLGDLDQGADNDPQLLTGRELIKRFKCLNNINRNKTGKNMQIHY